MSETQTPKPSALSIANLKFNDHGIDVTKLTPLELAMFDPATYKPVVQTFVQDETLPYEAE
jgi:hypothetical protein